MPEQLVQLLETAIESGETTIIWAVAIYAGARFLGLLSFLGAVIWGVKFARSWYFQDKGAGQ